MTYQNSSIAELVFAPHPKLYNFLNLTGHQYSQLTVLGYAGKQYWYCQCDCGSITSVFAGRLRNSHTKSCGCRKAKATSECKRIHGESNKTPEYAAYKRARSRCNNPHAADYYRYGGRGIQFLFESYEQFLNELGRRPSSKYSLDRINNEGHYETGNVRWATLREQNNNQRTNKRITYNGLTHTLAEWARIIDKSAACLSLRLTRLKWCVPCTLTLPAHQSCPHRE